jgi:beta-ureidopropionase / N-carbamoyl-L-amino-acid hydrolase
MVGALDGNMLQLTEPLGEKLSDALRRVGGDPDKLDQTKRSDIKAFLELHIEQGIVLESQSLDVGIVTSIVGIRRIEVIFEGAADHAGTTPLGLRHDALVAASRTVTAVRERAQQLAEETAGFFVATVGILVVEPNASNVVPGRCRLVIDARTTDPALTRRFATMLDRDTVADAAAASVRRVAFATLSDGPPVACAPVLREALREGARKLGLRSCDLASGAGHDAAFMSRICPSAMVFVPSKAGKSHAPEEWTERDQLAAGAAVMLEALKTLDKSLAGEVRANSEM